MKNVDDRELLGKRSERAYANTTPGVMRRLRRLALLNGWTLSKTIHVMLLLGLGAYEREMFQAEQDVGGSAAVAEEVEGA